MLTNDDRWSGTTSIMFGIASGALSVLVPLTLIRNEHSALVVGLVATLAGVSQLMVRFTVPALLRRMPDRAVVLMSGTLLSLALLVPMLTQHLPWMIAVQLVHGAVRALFWTGIQTHVVRGESVAIKGLAVVNFAAGAGLMLGPAAVGGIIVIGDFSLAFTVSLVLSIGTCVASMMLLRYAPFAAHRGVMSKAAWTPDSVLGSMMSGIAGSWRGILDTYMAVILVALAFSEAAVSILIAVSSGSILLGTLLASRARKVSNRGVFVAGVGGTALALVSLPLSEGRIWLTLVAMLLGGLISGLFQTLGTAIAAEGVPTELKGDAITLTGIFRSAGILGVPGAMSALIPVLPLFGVFSLTGAGLTLSLVAAVGKKRRDT